LNQFELPLRILHISNSWLNINNGISGFFQSTSIDKRYGAYIGLCHYDNRHDQRDFALQDVRMASSAESGISTVTLLYSSACSKGLVLHQQTNDHPGGSTSVPVTSQ
jgi:hypothetical protein